MPKFWTNLLCHLTRAKIRRQFQRRRQELETEFSESILLREENRERAWHDFHWLADPVIFVRDDRQEPHQALVGVAAISTLRQGDGATCTHAGTAVFFYQEGAWKTHGQLLLDLTPSEAMERLSNRFASLP